MNKQFTPWFLQDCYSFMNCEMIIVNTKQNKIERKQYNGFRYNNIANNIEFDDKCEYI